MRTSIAVIWILVVVYQGAYLCPFFCALGLALDSLPHFMAASQAILQKDSLHRPDHACPFKHVHRSSIWREGGNKQDRSWSVPWTGERGSQGQRGGDLVAPNWVGAGGTTCGRTSSQFLEFQKQLLLQSEWLGHLPNSNLLVGDRLPLHASRLSVHTWSRSLSKKLNNFHFENDCRDSCHSIHNHGWRQQCTTSKQPERSDIVIPKDHKTTRDYHAHDGSLPDRSELIPAQRQDTISYSSSSFFQVSIGYATMRWPLKMFSKTRTLYLMSFKSCQTHHSWSESN